MANYLPLPDGRYFELPEGVKSEQEAVALAMQRFPELYRLSPEEKEPEPETGFVAGLKSGFESLKGDIGAIGAGLGIEGGAEYAKAQREKAAQIAQTPELSEDPWGYVTTLLGQSAAYMAAPVAGALAVGSAPVSGALGLGATAAGLLGAGTVSAAQFTGSNLSRQLEEGTAPEDLKLGAAVAAAVPQAALDTVALKFIPGVNKLVGKFGRELTKEESLKAAKKLAEAGAAGLIKAGGAKTLQTAGIEGLTEAGQQVFERMQAGLDLMDEQARGEYIDNFVGGATLGGLFGAGSRIGAQGRARDEVAQEEQRVAAVKAAEEKRLADEAAAAEQAAFDQQVAGTMQQQVIPGTELVEDVRDKAAKAVQAADEAQLAAERERRGYGVEGQQQLYEDLFKQADQRAEVLPEGEELIQQRQSLQRVLEDNQQQMSDALAAKDMEAYKRLRDQRGAMSKELEAVDAQLKELGVEDQQQQLQLQEQIAKEQAKLFNMAGPGFDPDKAARIEKRIADLQQQAPQQDMFGAAPQLLDLNARNEQARREAAQAELDARQADLLGTIPKREKADPLRLLKQAMEVDDATRKEQAFDALFENVFDKDQPRAVPVPETITPMPRLDFKAANNQFNGMLKKVETLSNSMLASNREKADKVRDDINDIRQGPNKYLKLAFDARAEQDTALNRFVEMLTEIRAGVYFGGAGRAPEASVSTLEGLKKQANEAKAAYVRGALQEAALHRRAEGRPEITVDEALKAASDMDAALSDALEEISTRAPADRSDAYKETRIVLPAQMRSGQVVQSAVLETRDSRPLEERPFGAPRAAQEVIVDGLKVLPKIRDSLIGGRQVTAVKPVLRTQFAQQEARETAEARGETGGTPQQQLRRRRNYVAGLINRALERDMPERIRTALEKALGVIETKDATRARLVDALEGNLPDNIRASMEAALDAIDKGVPSTALLDAAENQASRIIRGADSGKVSRDITTKTKEVAPGSRAVSPPSKQGKSAVPPLLISRERVTGTTTEEGTIGFEAVQELEEALLPAGTTAIDQREAGQKSLFAGPADKRREERELGVIRRSYDALMKAPAVRAGREAAEKIAGRVRMLKIAQDAAKRYTDAQVELQEQIAEIRRRISESDWMVGASLNKLSASNFIKLTPAEYVPVMTKYNAMVEEVNKQNQLLKQKRAETTAGLTAQVKALEEQQKRVKEGAKNFFAVFAKTDPSVFADPVLASEQSSAEALFNRRTELLNQQRNDLQAAVDAAMMRVTAEMRAAKNDLIKQADALEQQGKEAILKLEKAREAAAEEGVSKEGLKVFADTEKKLDALNDEILALRKRAAEDIETTAIVAEATRDTLVQFEFKILEKYEKELKRAKDKLEVERLTTASTEQRRRAAKAETAARLAKEAAAREQRAVEQRLLKGEGIDRIKITGGKKPDTPLVNEDAVRFQKIMNSVDDVLEERKAAKGKRAIGPVTRTQSAAPASMRGGTEESKAGLGRTGTSQRLSEARGVKQKDVPITRAEMAAPADMSVEEFGKLSLEEQTAELNRRQMKADLKALDTAKRTITSTRGTKEQIAEDKRIAEEEYGIDVSKPKWRQKLRAEIAKEDAIEAEKIASMLTKGKKSIADVMDEDVDAAEDNYLRENSAAYDTPSFTKVRVNVIRALQAGDAVKAAELLAESGSDPLTRKLAGMLAQLLGDTKVEMVSDLYVDGKRAAGNYMARRGVLQYDVDAVSEETILHEMIHAATLRALKAPMETLTAAQQAARKELESMFASLKGNTRLAREYGMTDVSEFASELLSNRVLQEKLAGVKWSGGGNFFTRFINKLLTFLGFKESVDFRNKATQNIINLFERAMPMTEGRQIENAASVLRGVFPGTAPTAFGGVSPEAQKATLSGVAQTQSKAQRIQSAFLSDGLKLSLRTQLLDRFAPIEELLRKGVARGKLETMRMFQTLFYLRFSENSSQYAATAASVGGLELRYNKDESSYTFEEVEGTSIFDMAATLAEAEIGNETFAETMLTKWLAGFRAGNKEIGWDKLDLRDPAKAKADWEVINRDVQNNPKIKAAFEKIRKDYRDYNGRLLDLAVATGAITPEKAANLKKLDYVPFYRDRGDSLEMFIDKEHTILIGDLKNQPYLKELVGGEKEILPVFTSALQNTKMLVDMSIRNMATKDTAYSLMESGYSVVRDGSGPALPNVVRFFEKGQPKHAIVGEWKKDPKTGKLEMTSDIMDGVPADLLVKGMSGIKATIPAAVRALAFPAKILRRTVTALPTYAFRQIIRDSTAAWITTGSDATPILSATKEFAKLMRKQSEAGKKLQSAGAISTNVFTGDNEDIAVLVRQLAKGKKNLSLNSLWSSAETLSMNADAATRAVLYSNYRAKGLTHMQAVLGSLESMNFGRHGVSPSMKMVSMMIPFFNAQIQGLDVLYRTARGKSLFEGTETADKAMMKVRQTMLRRGLMLSAGTIAYAALMGDEDPYKNATLEQRAQSWFVPFPGTDAFFRIPIPFEIGLVFKALPEIIWNVATTDDKAAPAAKAFGSLLWQQTPFSIPQAFKPAIEVATNYSFFTGAPIETARMQNLEKSERFNTYTPEAAKFLSYILGNVVSPVQVEYLVRGYTSTLGAMVLAVPDLLARPLLSDVERPERLITEYPGLSSLFQPADGRGVISEAFDRIEDFQQAKSTYNKMIEEGRQAEAKAFAQKYATEMAANSIGGSFRQKMGELAKIRRAIAGSTTLSAAEKRERITQVKKLEIELAKRIRAIE